MVDNERNKQKDINLRSSGKITSKSSLRKDDGSPSKQPQQKLTTTETTLVTLSKETLQSMIDNLKVFISEEIEKSAKKIQIDIQSIKKEMAEVKKTAIQANNIAENAVTRVKEVWPAIRDNEKATALISDENKQLKTEVQNLRSKLAEGIDRDLRDTLQCSGILNENEKSWEDTKLTLNKALSSITPTNEVESYYVNHMERCHRAHKDNANFDLIKVTSHDETANFFNNMDIQLITPLDFTTNKNKHKQ